MSRATTRPPYFNDFRNTGRPKVQGLKEAIGVESNSTIFNPKYIREMMKGEASSMETFAETFRNTFGWNAMKPSAIDQHIWNKYYDVYIEDAYGLGLEQTFTEKNPYVLQEMTAVMLEAGRKGMWQASDAQLRQVAALHTRLVAEHAAGCSGFVCDNAKLRAFIASKVDQPAAEAYNRNIDAARQVQIEEQTDRNVVLKKEEQTRDRRHEDRREANAPTRDYTVPLGHRHPRRRHCRMADRTPQTESIMEHYIQVIFVLALAKYCLKAAMTGRLWVMAAYAAVAAVVALGTLSGSHHPARSPSSPACWPTGAWSPTARC